MRSPAVAKAACAAVALASVVLSSTTPVVAQRQRGCGAQYAGTPYLKCNREQGREALPETCTRYYRNCNGVQVHLSTVCVSPIRGSIEHRILASACDATATVSPPPGEDPDHAPVPADFDAMGFINAGTPDPVLAYPDIKVFDFGDGRGAVPAHRHPNGRGVVADSVVLGDPKTVYIGPDVRVYGKAVIGSDVVLLGHAQVYGEAVVTSGSFVANEARVFGQAALHYFAGALDRSTVAGARLECGGMTRDDAVVGGKTIVEGYDRFTRAPLDCGKSAMSSKPGIVAGKAILYCSTVGAGTEVVSGTSCWKE